MSNFPFSPSVIDREDAKISIAKALYVWKNQESSLAVMQAFPFNALTARTQIFLDPKRGGSILDLTKTLNGVTIGTQIDTGLFTQDDINSITLDKCDYVLNIPISGRRSAHGTSGQDDVQVVSTDAVSISTINREQYDENVVLNYGLNNETFSRLVPSSMVHKKVKYLIISNYYQDGSITTGPDSRYEIGQPLELTDCLIHSSWIYDKMNTSSEYAMLGLSSNYETYTLSTGEAKYHTQYIHQLIHDIAGQHNDKICFLQEFNLGRQGAMPEDFILRVYALDADYFGISQLDMEVIEILSKHRFYLNTVLGDDGLNYTTVGQQIYRVLNRIKPDPVLASMHDHFMVGFTCSYFYDWCINKRNGHDVYSSCVKQVMDDLPNPAYLCLGNGTAVRNVLNNLMSEDASFSTMAPHSNSKLVSNTTHFWRVFSRVKGGNSLKPSSIHVVLNNGEQRSLWKPLEFIRSMITDGLSMRSCISLPKGYMDFYKYSEVSAMINIDEHNDWGSGLFVTSGVWGGTARDGKWHLFSYGIHDTYGNSTPAVMLAYDSSNQRCNFTVFEKSVTNDSMNLLFSISFPYKHKFKISDNLKIGAINLFGNKRDLSCGQVLSPVNTYYVKPSEKVDMIIGKFKLDTSLVKPKFIKISPNDVSTTSGKSGDVASASEKKGSFVQRGDTSSPNKEGGGANIRTNGELNAEAKKVLKDMLQKGATVMSTSGNLIIPTLRPDGLLPGLPKDTDGRPVDYLGYKYSYGTGSQPRPTGSHSGFYSVVLIAIGGLLFENYTRN